MMSPAAAVAVALVSGLAVGVFFFGGLWWTVRRGTDSSAPALWFSASSLLRTIIALGVFYLVSNGHWQGFLACLSGFLLARIAVARTVMKAAP